ADSARRFASAQVDNFHRRLDQVRDGDNRSSNGLALNLGFAGEDRMNDPRAELAQRLGLPGGRPDDRYDLDGRPIEVVNPLAAGVSDDGGQVPGARSHAAEGEGGGSAVGLWTAGGIDWGRRDGQTGERDYRFSTSGLSAGADMKVSDTLILGGGLGYGYDRTKIGSDDSLSEGESWLGVIYGGWRPAEGLHISGLIGGGSLDYESRRWASAASDFAFGERSGSLMFGSLEASVDRTSGAMRWSPYARLETASVTLDAFTETGAGIYALTYDEMSFDSLSSTLGVRFGWLMQGRDSTFAPAATVEWSHAFDDAGGQGVRYADWASSPLYIVPLSAWSRDTLSVDLEGRWSVGSNFDLTAAYRGSVGSDMSSHGIRLRLLTRF
ncbi:MAG TPA: autotransporter outer membrane beta-barrel domain-containing protein, partial [Allosphingosinicella sp.]